MLHAVLLKHAKFALQGMRAFKGLMMEFQMHETIPRGGVFKIR